MDCIVHGVTESDMTELTSLTLTGFKHFIYLKLCSIKIICKIQQLKLVKKKKSERYNWWPELPPTNNLLFLPSLDARYPGKFCGISMVLRSHVTEMLKKPFQSYRLEIFSVQIRPTVC